MDKGFLVFTLKEEQRVCLLTGKSILWQLQVHGFFNEDGNFCSIATE
jgi:hypothetical protein